MHEELNANSAYVMILNQTATFSNNYILDINQTSTWFDLSSLYASDFLNDTSIANPQIDYLSSFMDSSLVFFLKITDSVGCQAYDTVIVTASYFNTGLLDWTFSIKQGDSIFLDKGANISGGYDPITFSWSPVHGLIDSNQPDSFWAKPDTTISYTPTITDSKNCQFTAGPYYHITVIPLGIKAIDCHNCPMIVYPNPVTEVLFFDVPEKVNIVKTRIVTLNGIEVLVQYENTKSLRLDFIPDGVYLLEVHTTDHKVHLSKIIKKS
jgi:Zn-finger protein